MDKRPNLLLSLHFNIISEENRRIRKAKTIYKNKPPVVCEFYLSDDLKCLKR